MDFADIVHVMLREGAYTPREACNVAMVCKSWLEATLHDPRVVAELLTRSAPIVKSVVEQFLEHAKPDIVRKTILLVSDNLPQDSALILAPLAAKHGHTDALKKLVMTSFWDDDEGDDGEGGEGGPQTTHYYLMKAVKHGRADTVRMLLDPLQLGARRASADWNDSRAVDVAAEHGHDDVLEALLGAGAGVLSDGDRGPIIAAAGRGHTDVVRRLLRHGAVSDAVPVPIDDWGHPLITRITSGRDAYEAALDRAIEATHFDVVKALVEQEGAPFEVHQVPSLNNHDHLLECATEKAVREGLSGVSGVCMDILRCLLQTYDPADSGSRGYKRAVGTCVATAVTSIGTPAVLHSLLQELRVSKPYYSASAMVQAARANNVPTLSALLDMSDGYSVCLCSEQKRDRARDWRSRARGCAFLDISDGDSEQRLHNTVALAMAAGRGHADTVRKLLSTRTDIDELLESGTDAGRCLSSALGFHRVRGDVVAFAARQGYTEVVQLLVDRVPYREVRDGTARGALEAAAIGNHVGTDRSSGRQP